MIKSITVVNQKGESLKMELANYNESGFLITSVDGLGPVQADINTTDIVTFDGTVYNSVRARNRNIVINLQFVSVDIENQRHICYRYFPLKRPVTVKIVTDHRKLQTMGYVESNAPDIFSRNETAQISLVCPDAYFQDISDEGVNTVDFYGVDPLFEFPFSNESRTERRIQFGNIKNSFEETFLYDGEAETGIVMMIHALEELRNDITITNVTTLGRMVISMERIKTITGKYPQTSDDIIISTIKGHKQAILQREGKAYNILNALGRDTEWFQVTQGENTFAYQSSDSGTLKIKLSLTVQNLYVGV